MVWVLQALVLAVTAALWWAARRDLTARAAEARAPAVEDWSRLRVTVEQLMVELERRAVVAEQRIYEAEQRLRLLENRLQAPFARAENASSASVPAESTSDAPSAPSAERVSFEPVPMPPTPAINPAPITNSVSPLTAPLLLPGTAASPVDADSPAALMETAPSLPSPPSAGGAVTPSMLPEDTRYLPVYALADGGETDAAEIARQTGLPRGEVELVLSLRVRRPA